MPVSGWGEETVWQAVVGLGALPVAGGRARARFFLRGALLVGSLPVVRGSFDFSGDANVFRTPTESTVYLTKGERRFFLKRVTLAEDWRPGYDSRRRRWGPRRAYQATGLRIQRPDLSEIPASQKARTWEALLAERKSWPEILLFKKRISKSDGQWRLGLRELAADEPTWSSWIYWLMEALSDMTMPSGIKVHADGWWMDSYSRGAQIPLDREGEETVTEYLVHMWRPGGNLPPLIIEYDLMRSVVEVSVVSNGNGNELWLWPLSASLFEVPVLEPSAQLAVTGIGAVHSARVDVDGNFTNETMMTEEAVAFPCVVGQLSADSCSAALGCVFGETLSGASDQAVTGGWQVYDSWAECQQRCCHDEDCLSVTWDNETKICKTHMDYLDLVLTSSATGMYAPIASRAPSTDGFKAMRSRLEWQGAPVGQYPGHRSVTFCKAMCAAEPLCNSIVYHDTHGCFLRTACVYDHSIRSYDYTDDAAWTFYKTQPKCKEVYDWTEEERLGD
ncbi:unnamed protein product [Effrenium voratum]|uniref:Apple domain-containing protein n=1 Tax=Effrenium voratum TaxID=2562239 RepID=A0AA36HTW8_9DINO|nr:unnamed protein product [Effrenium voratum]